MKSVIEITADSAKYIEVQDNFIECSVCGKWKDPTEYRKVFEAGLSQSRTNCTDCYLMDISDMRGLKEITNHHRNNLSHSEKAQIRKFENTREIYSYSVSVADMLKMLSKMKPDDRIIITQDGHTEYYDDGDVNKYCDVCLNPSILEEIDGVKVYDIANSHS